MEKLKQIISKQSTRVGASIFLILVIVGASYSAGYSNGKENPRTIQVEGIKNTDGKEVEADFAVFWDAWDKLRTYHLRSENVTDKKFLYGAIDGLAGSFDDPNTVFFPPAESKNFTQTLEGHFGGIGAEIGLNRENELVIVIPLKSSPAERAGLEGGDKIIKINDETTTGISVDEAVSKIRGPIGTEVNLAIFRESWGAPRNIVIKRETIVVPTINTTIKDRIAHVALYSFNAEAGNSFRNEGYLKSVLSGAKGMVLDLRDNPGGFLEVAVDIAGWFLERGQVVAIERFADGDEQQFRAHGNEALAKMPLVILVNANSASASEILAGAIKDYYPDVTIIGEQEKTYGKGTVQEVRELVGDNGSLKITVGEWLRPSHQSIDKVGIVPDIVVKRTQADFDAKKDPPLDKAYEILKAKIK